MERLEAIRGLHGREHARSFHSGLREVICEDRNPISQPAVQEITYAWNGSDSNVRKLTAAQLKLIDFDGCGSVSDLNAAGMCHDMVWERRLRKQERTKPSGTARRSQADQE